LEDDVEPPLDELVVRRRVLASLDEDVEVEDETREEEEEDEEEEVASEGFW